ncbi:DUF3574 domain-containing protein [Roseomonas sp. M0104]|uniref:DUF3574 domain-containing protein n=1 Tax=Teichococcus coralli TaxID=2545983 RepID=A0A845BKN1_9PROT|nr:DUF3574 domain-containing protein [Pseudoroseomonas coralli]MXP63969.1 DUF3574 domain-containing protein [Pseudoroseomonas coralli]
MPRLILPLRVLPICLLLGACAGCPGGQTPATVAELFFGRSVPGGGTVGEAEWDAFLADTVTPAFPQGLTVQDAQGQWRGADGEVVREPAKRLLLVLPETSADRADARVAPLAENYRARFRQESVLRLQHAACVAF